MNTPKYLEIAELIRIDIFVKYVSEDTLRFTMSIPIPYPVLFVY
jgi:hypothetical protein